MKEKDTKPMERDVDLSPEDPLPAIMRQMLAALGEDPERDGLQEEVIAVAVGVATVGEASRAPVRVDGRTATPAEAPPGARAGRGHEAAALPRSGDGLIPLGHPRVDESAIVQALDDQASGIAQHHAAGAG